MGFLLLLFLSLFSGISPAKSESPEYAVCARPLLLDCGGKGLNVSYPFTAGDRPEFCGYGGKYRLRCEGGYSAVTDIGGISFLVGSIDYEARALGLEWYGGGCSSGMDETLFKYADDLIHSVLTNCSLEDANLEVYPICQRSYLLPEDSPAEWIAKMKCSGVVRVPFRRSAGASPAAYPFLFDVNWRAGESWCENCVGSGGACGYNSSLPEAPVCFCSGGSSTSGTCRTVKGTRLIEGSSFRHSAEQFGACSFF